MKNIKVKRLQCRILHNSLTRFPYKNLKLKTEKIQIKVWWLIVVNAYFVTMFILLMCLLLFYVPKNLNSVKLITYWFFRNIISFSMLSFCWVICIIVRHFNSNHFFCNNSVFMSLKYNRSTTMHAFVWALGFLFLNLNVCFVLSKKSELIMCVT